MNIIKASPADIVEVLYLLKVCVLEMNIKGWYHWDMQNHLVKYDIENNSVFLYKENEVSVGAITLNNEEIAEYKDIKWSHLSNNPLVVHRLLVHPNWREKGVAKELLVFSENFAKENGFTSLRLEVFSENQEAVGLYNQLNYKQQGEIQLHYQKSPYYCFEKTL